MRLKKSNWLNNLNKFKRLNTIVFLAILVLSLLVISGCKNNSNQNNNSTNDTITNNTSIKDPFELIQEIPIPQSAVQVNAFSSGNAKSISHHIDASYDDLMKFYDDNMPKEFIPQNNWERLGSGFQKIYATEDFVLAQKQGIKIQVQLGDVDGKPFTSRLTINIVDYENVN